MDVVCNPTDPWAWAGLVGDAVDLAVPFVSGVGEVTRSARIANDTLTVVSKVSDDAIDTYSSLRKINKGTGNEVHHIVEKRFAPDLNIPNTNEMLSVALDKETHRMYTNEWRHLLPYKQHYTRIDLIKAATTIYKNEPALLRAALKTILKEYT